MKASDEASRIYYVLLQKEIPNSIALHFERVSKIIEKKYTKKQVATCLEHMKRTRDLESLEIASRYLNRLPLLTEKFRIMAYLAETVPENYRCYVNERDKRFYAYARMFFSIVFSMKKFLKGLLILVKHRLCGIR